MYAITNGSLERCDPCHTMTLHVEGECMKEALDIETPEFDDARADAIMACRRKMLEQYTADPMTIHIGPLTGPTRCGRVKGRVTPDPVRAQKYMRKTDRFCSVCWNQWAKAEGDASV